MPGASLAELYPRLAFTLIWRPGLQPHFGFGSPCSTRKRETLRKAYWSKGDSFKFVVFVVRGAILRSRAVTFVATLRVPILTLRDKLSFENLPHEKPRNHLVTSFASLYSQFGVMHKPLPSLRRTSHFVSRGSDEGLSRIRSGGSYVNPA